MPTSRYKKVQKNLGFYVNNYKFRQPFQILIDGTFAFAALQNKFNIHDQLSKYLNAEVKLLTTACIISETEKLSTFFSAVTGAMQIVKQYAVHKCGHAKKPISGSKCLQAMIGKDNSSKYIIATQDRELQEQLSLLPGVPLLYLHGKTPTLKSPSEASCQHAENLQRDLGMTVWEKENVKKLREHAGIVKKDTKSRRKKKKSNPNPLSCLKKKKKPETTASNQNSTKSGKIRKRKNKIKIASHVKEALIKELKGKHEASGNV